MLTTRNVLTPEQRQQAGTLMEQHRKRMHNRWEERQDNRGMGRRGVR